MIIKFIEFFIFILPFGWYGISQMINGNLTDGLIWLGFAIFCTLSIIFYKDYNLKKSSKIGDKL